MENVPSRKRSRSYENSHSPQRKYFVNDRLMSTQNENRLEEVRNKTLHMLFKGANQKPSSSSDPKKFQLDSVLLCGDGTFHFDRDQKPPGFPTISKKSKCCSKEAFIDSECRNCNLSVCEYCAYSCVICRELLCSTCVVVFNCGTVDTPCCEQCRQYS